MALARASAGGLCPDGHARAPGRSLYLHFGVRFVQNGHNSRQRLQRFQFREGGHTYDRFMAGWQSVQGCEFTIASAVRADMPVSGNDLQGSRN